MTPGARVQAAIECLDAILDGRPAEQCLTGWARSNRFAGSKDRAAVRDLVYSALRRRASLAWIGGALTGRGLMIGLARAEKRSLDDLFSGQGYAPKSLSDDERSSGRALSEADWAVCHDVPEWLSDEIRRDLGDRADALCLSFGDRAPVFLRVNLSRASREDVQHELETEGIAVAAHGDVPTALVAEASGNRLRTVGAFSKGLFEIQDVTGQAAIAAITPGGPPSKILDFCAGGGGKALAMADRWPDARLVAHDVSLARMKDIPERARRAHATVSVQDPNKPFGETEFDLVLCDVPCSGSGTWRRQPDAKWKLTDETLNTLTETQSSILGQANRFVGVSGQLIYMTCSLLSRENEDRIDAFLEENADWHCVGQERFDGIKGGDVFFLATLTRKN